MHTKSRILFLLAVPFAFAAHAADANLDQPVPHVATKTPSPLPAGETERTVEFALWKSAVQPRDVVGKVERGLFCSEDVPLRYGKNVDEWLVQTLTKAFKERAVSLGFDSAETSRSVFADKGSGADFRLGATLIHLDYRVCGDENVKGAAYAKVKWEAFSQRRQKVVYTQAIESSYATETSIKARDFDKAFFGAIVDNLLGDPKFVDVVKTGGNSAGDEPARALPPLTLETGTVLSGPVNQAASRYQEAVVTVESGVGHGSGFFISQAGYLLTNYHVVADAKFVRVKMAGGRSVVGEVIRVDKQRDVALLRADPVSTPVLNPRRTPSKPGEEVYVVGSPFGEALSGTLTRGVLSSRRVFDGVAYLQSDVAVNPGNSGGPLLDATGHVLGMAQLQLTAQGINLFIPIDEIVDKLALTLKLPQAAAQTR